MPHTRPAARSVSSFCVYIEAHAGGCWALTTWGIHVDWLLLGAGMLAATLAVTHMRSYHCHWRRC